MKSHYHIIILLCALFWIGPGYAWKDRNPSKAGHTVEPLLILSLELKLVRELYAIQRLIIWEQLNWCKQRMQQSAHFEQWRFYFRLTEEQRRRFDALESAMEENIVRLKYLKGLEVIKLLYEKSLTLDHHFSSVITFNEISKLSNPNQYKEFADLQDYLHPKRKKEQGFDLSPILGSNIYTSVIHSMVSLFTQGTDKTDKEQKLKDIECILDFTLRMHQDLNTIYFETHYLQQGNTNIKEELQALFLDFVQPIGYNNNLDHCRSMDDWDTIRKLLGTYLEAENGYESNLKTPQWIEIDFPVHQLIQFIVRYNLFIDQGDRFYEKFHLMLNSYQHQAECAEELPIAFNALQENIEISLKKFKTAYKPVEINGSRLKAILYGINEYKQ